MITTQDATYLAGLFFLTAIGFIVKAIYDKSKEKSVKKFMLATLVSFSFSLLFGSNFLRLHIDPKDPKETQNRIAELVHINPKQVQVTDEEIGENKYKKYNFEYKAKMLTRDENTKIKSIDFDNVDKQFIYNLFKELNYPKLKQLDDLIQNDRGLCFDYIDNLGIMLSSNKDQNTFNVYITFNEDNDWLWSTRKAIESTYNNKKSSSSKHSLLDELK
ncbi:hypothetical protein [Aerococcus urinae]|uniref:Uncharacterized protein n=1 Tax=Aerococcus urinae TaxID=1376 RepID=A0A0X8FF36_9LACT|nr:hypothetical protein [Aerococcus urinae]AMB96181.1 hypothetical protein AWM73_06505 [Aerococcus urinae]MCY3033226.1 hypothetical protein [Aerococcus urinae]MCY3038611.1 hypothetical protein [Aerococcus urinae]MCY3045332.1 hypothetical protein [Aerococcus urinae]MCY3047064.1 hypothetical protein [Aerococcus urinae]